MKWHWYYYPLALATLPTLLAFLFVVKVFYGVREWRWHDHCLEFVAKEKKKDHTNIWGRPEGQCWGTLAIVFDSDIHHEWRVIAVHERVHALHGIWLNAAGTAVFTPLGIWVWWPLALLGPLTFALAYGGHFLIEFARKRSFWPAYFAIWSERIAYRIDDEFERGLRPEAWGK